MGFGTEFVVGVAAVLAAIWFAYYLVSAYNGLVQLRNDRLKALANIDVLLKQRNDEVPNLVETVKGYMTHEREVLTKITEARTSVMSARTIAEKGRSDAQLTGALKTLFAVVEAYPDLKANQGFLRLQQRITALENEISDRREFYNDATNLFNTKVETFPDMIVARLMGWGRGSFFAAAQEERQAVQVRV